MVHLEVKKDLLATAIVQLLILSTAWVFFIVVRLQGTLPLPDAAAMWVFTNPTETMLLITIIATAANAVTLGCFTKAAKHALRQHIGAQGSISLASLGIGVAAASASFTFKPKSRYLGPTIGTLFIATVFGLVNSAWTTFLNPVQINVLVPMYGKELDLGNQEFDAVLGQDMNNTFSFSNGTLVEPVPISSNSLTSFGFTGGSSRAAAVASGQSLILNFNNATYNVSTGGILPAVPGYGSTQGNIPRPVYETPASFGGGPIPSNLNASTGLTGISSIYNIVQQGLTANVSCYNYTNSADWYPFEIEEIAVNATLVMNPYLPGVYPSVNTTVPHIICNPDISGDGNTGSIAVVNYDNSNYLASVICPSTWLGAMNTDKIVVYHVGFGKYASLTPTICEIVPLLTQSSVVYASQLVAAATQNTTTIPNQQNLNYWVTLFLQLEQWGFQTGRLNTLGNMLLSLLTSGPLSLSEAPTQSFQLFLQEYWKGVVEVAGTALRSGYTVFPQNVTSMQIPMGGTQNVTTMGWSFGNNARTYAVVPITLAAFMTFAAIFLAIYPVRSSKEAEGGPESQSTENIQYNSQLGSLVVPHSAIGTFDASNPIHLIVAGAAQSAAPRSTHRRRYWDQHDEAQLAFQVQHHRDSN